MVTTKEITSSVKSAVLDKMKKISAGYFPDNVACYGPQMCTYECLICVIACMVTGYTDQMVSSPNGTHSQYRFCVWPCSYANGTCI